MKKIAEKYKHFDSSYTTPSQRKFRLLNGVQHTLLFTLIISLILILIFSEEKIHYISYHIIGIVTLLNLLHINAHGKSQFSVYGTILLTMLMPWIVIIGDSLRNHFDLIPLVYISIAIFISSIFLSFKEILTITVVQLSLLIGILIYFPQLANQNWISLVIYIIVFSTLSTVSNLLYKDTIKQILSQSSQLIKSNTELVSMKDTLMQHENVLFQMAYYDTLTKLGNQKKFEKDANTIIDQNSPLSVLYVDLDNFKWINDTYDHVYGDLLLQRFSNHLNNVFNKDFIYRWSGDEFLILIESDDNNEIFKSITNINHFFTSEIIIRDIELSLSSSIGIAKYPADASDYSSLFKNADLALQKAKESGKASHVFYTPSLQDEIESFNSIRKFIEVTLSENNFFLFYQPIVNLKTNLIESYEVLLRWDSKDNGINIGELIYIAEKTGQILNIDQWVVEEAFRIVSQNKEVFKNINISINLSSQSFLSENFLDFVKKMVYKYHIDTAQFELEVTEHTIIDNIEYSRAMMDKLKGLGFKIALDDFGTKYSSINYLTKFPFDRLKIDKTYIDNIKSNGNEKIIVKHIIELANDLNLETVAEGIEHTDQEEILKSLGCHFGQGYLFAKPMDFENLKKVSLNH